MTLHDVYLLSPELSLAAVGLAIIVLDLLVERKGVLAALAVVGLVVPLAFSIALFGDLSGEPNEQMTGIFGTLVVDKFALFFKFLVLGVLALVIMASVDYVSKMRHFQGEYYGLMVFSAGGMMLLASTTELITIYIALELTALPLAALAAFLRDSRSSEAGIKFLLLSAMSSAVLLYGMVLTFGFTGTTQLSEIFERLGSSIDSDVSFGSPALFLGVILIVAGFGFKVSSVPFQMWVPDVYEGAPTPITAYLSVASKAAGFAVILRVFYLAFGEISLDWGVLFAALSALSMTVGNLVAIAQSNIKRMLAYSTIAQAGYLMVGIAAIAVRAPEGETPIGPSSVLFYLGAYAVTNLAAFFAIIAITTKHRQRPDKQLCGNGKARSSARLRIGLLPGVPDGHPADRGLHGQAVPLQRRRSQRPCVAGGCGRGEQRPLRLLLRQGHQDHVHGEAGVRGAGDHYLRSPACHLRWPELASWRWASSRGR